jgi:hypothetical protein
MHLRFVRWIVALAKNSPWLLIAVGLHVIVAAAMSVVYIRHELSKNDVQPTAIKVAARTEAPEVIQPPEPIDRKKIPENDKQAELVSYEEEQTFVPTEDVVEEDLFLDVGDPTGSDDGDEGATGGTSIGVGVGGHHGTGVVSTIVSRRPSSKAGTPKKGRRTGETEGTEESVLEGLRWLVRHQNEDGSWGADTVTQHCNPKKPCIPPDVEQDASYNLGMTSLSLLAFLGHGISMESKLDIVDTAMGKRHRAGDVVKGGVRWLMERQREDGSFTDSEPFEYPENETLSTMVLCEAHGLSQNREVKRQAQRAVDFLVSAQKRRPDGSLSGWGLGTPAGIEARFARGDFDQAGYDERIGAVDLSITCWVVMALRSAQSCGFDVPPEALQGALTYAVEAAAAQPLQGDAGAAADENQAARRSALAMLILSFGGAELSDPLLEAAAQQIAKEVPKVTADPLSVDFYYWYFATLALYQYDGPDSPREGAGEYWEPWNKGLVKSLLPLQDDDEAREACGRGGWLSEARGNQRGRALYNTALNVLTLEVYYRYANVFGLK